MIPVIAGVIVSVLIAWGARVLRLDRGNLVFPVTLVVIALFYILFALRVAAFEVLLIESIIAGIFVLLAWLGFRISPLVVAFGVFFHGVFDLLHDFWIFNPGMPLWWPIFCAVVDFILASWLILLYFRGR